MKKVTKNQLSACYFYLKFGEQASDSELKKVYRKRMAMCHPDLNPSPEAHEISQRVNGAYDIIEGVRSGKYRLIGRITQAPVAKPPKKYGETKFSQAEMDTARVAFEKRRKMTVEDPFSELSGRMQVKFVIFFIGTCNACFCMGSRLVG